jgi:hypothetical protein
MLASGYKPDSKNRDSHRGWSTQEDSNCGSCHRAFTARENSAPPQGGGQYATGIEIFREVGNGSAY